jgi:hypothetical protein
MRSFLSGKQASNEFDFNLFNCHVGSSGHSLQKTPGHHPLQTELWKQPPLRDLSSFCWLSSFWQRGINSQMWSGQRNLIVINKKAYTAFIQNFDNFPALVIKNK